MHKPPYVLAIDLGTSGPKVALISVDGSVVGDDFEPVDLLPSPGGGAEQPAVPPGPSITVIPTTSGSSTRCMPFTRSRTRFTSICGHRE